MQTRHLPVLLDEVKDALRLPEGDSTPRLLFDGTLGGAGHSEALLDANPALVIFAMDRDEEAVSRARIRLGRFPGRVYFASDNYSNFAQYASSAKEALFPVEQIDSPLKFDRVLLDLGLSSDQLDDAPRGFSFQSDGPLDMRLDQRELVTAEKLLNESSERELSLVFKKGGVGSLSRALTRAVINARPLSRTSEFREVCKSILSRRDKSKGGSSRKDPATVPFQALRIAVNREIESLESFLEQILMYLKPGGRLAVISFHSLEDKATASKMRSWATAPESLRGLPTRGTLSGKGRLLTSKAIVPSEQESAGNPRARSARMRVFEKYAREIDEKVN